MFYKVIYKKIFSTMRTCILEATVQRNAVLALSALALVCHQYVSGLEKQEL